MKIANNIKALALFGVLSTASSCNYLEYDENKTYTDDVVWSDYTLIRRSLTSVYGKVPNGFESVGGGFMDAATDNAEILDQDCEINKFNLGVWNEFDNPDGAWNTNYEGIYLANNFIAHVDTVTLYKEQYDLTTKEERLKMIRYYRGEARFLKAYFYFELMKRYGEVPIAEEWEDEFTPIVFERSSVKDVANLIGDLCDDAVTYLPQKGDFTGDTYDNQLGRAFDGAAYALQSRAYLYAASKLFNESGLNNSLYIKSAQSAIKLFELNEYDLADSYSSLFNPGTSSMQNNREVIFDIRNAESNALEINNYPIGFYNGEGQTNPTQDLVDAYEFKDGTKFDWNNPTHVENIYKDRDDRFYATILYNGAVMGTSSGDDGDGTERAIETFKGGLDASNTVVDGTRTGYYLRKYIKLDADMREAEKSRHYWPLFRYAEVLLNYAEAIAEISKFDSGRAAALETEGGITAIEALNEVRDRSGLIALSGITGDELIEAIRRERRVELAFEGHRHWDVRRWKIAEQTIGQPIHGVEVSSTLNADLFNYKKIEVEERAFEEKMYLYPLPSNETFISNPLPQTPGW